MATASAAAAASAASSSGGGLESRILRDIELGDSFELLKRKLPRRSDLRKMEQQASVDFENHRSERYGRSAGSSSLLQRSASSPSALQGGGSAAGSPKGASPKGARIPERPILQRGFTLSKRPPIYSRIDNELSPGQYDTEGVFGFTWDKEKNVSNPSQKLVSNHYSSPLTSFAKPKHISPVAPKIAQRPGPGHYPAPNYWDPAWQRFPAAGKSFVRKNPTPSESRFGGLAKGFDKASNKGGGGMDFLGG